MTLAAVWVEASLDPQVCGTWPALGRPGAAGLLLVAGVQAGPAVSQWLDGQPPTSLLVLSRPEHRRQARYFGNVVSGSSPRTRVAFREVAAGPIAAMIRAGDVIGLGIDPSTALLAFDAAVAATCGGVWLRSVARLRTPTPTLGQHLRSLAPVGDGFLAVFNPAPRILSQGTIAEDGHPLLVAAAEGTPIPGLLRQAFPGASFHLVPGLSVPSLAYGSPGIEFMVDAPWSLPAENPSRACPVCGDPVPNGSACAFCHVLPRRQEAA